MQNNTTIIPIASGKGGVGKSLLAANISIALAQLGHPTVVVDLDFGGSNVYSFLGLRNKNRGIGDFLNDKSIKFDELRVSTEWPHLDFIPGDGQTPFLANLGYAQKTKLLSCLKNLSTKFLILDLGAGTSFNTLDFFRMSDRGLIVTNPEKIALMNMFVFLKNFVFRVINRSVPRKGNVSNLVNLFFQKTMTEEQVTIRSLFDQIQAIDRDTADNIQKICAKYTPRIIFNMVHHPDKLDNLSSISRLAANALSLNIDHFGVVFYDNTVLDSIEKGEPLLKFKPDCPSARNITILAGRIARMWEDDFENSAQKLFDNTQKIYEKLVLTDRPKVQEGG